MNTTISKQETEARLITETTGMSFTEVAERCNPFVEYSYEDYARDIIRDRMKSWEAVGTSQ
jgi:hypothetical protein